MSEFKVYDKAAWHIDGGEDQAEVVEFFTELYTFLSENALLSDEGQEILEIGIDTSISLHTRMVTTEGRDFLDRYYDLVYKQGYESFRIDVLSKAYTQYRQSQYGVAFESQNKGLDALTLPEISSLVKKILNLRSVQNKINETIEKHMSSREEV